MTDLLDGALRAVATRSHAAYPLVFAAGLVTSIGPCAAPRYVAVAALVNAARRPWHIAVPFALGLIGAYVVTGFGAGMLAALQLRSSIVYAG
ncbi:MAG TPA: hypothetical protein VGC96_10980, partial [Candidatus Elarobacter sp.]